MKTCVAIGVVVGIAASIHAQTRLEYQVSLAGAEDWHSSLSVAPGTSVDVRARVSYLGTAPVVGLGSIIFQPTLSNWLTTDTAHSVPAVGWSEDGPGVYGRLGSYSRTNAFNATDRYVGHLNTVGGVSYMRIALPQVTNWFGGSGNTAGGSGVLIGQINRDDPFRPAGLPTFSGQTTDIVAFKFMVTLGMTPDLRTLVVDTPALGFGNRQSNGDRTGNWFANYVEPTGSIREAAFASQAVINVIPAPGSIALLGLGALAAACRRRS